MSRTPISPVRQPVDVPSLEGIDLDGLIRSAEEIDRLAAMEPDPPKGRRKGGAKKATAAAAPTSTASEGETKQVEAEVVKPMSPEFPGMVTGLVGCGTTFMTLKMDWMDPGEKWKADVGGALARVIHHYMPVGSEHADLMILFGYISMYVTTNLVFKGTVPALGPRRVQ